MASENEKKCSNKIDADNRPCKLNEGHKSWCEFEPTTVPDSEKVSEEVHDIGWAVKRLKEGNQVCRYGEDWSTRLHLGTAVMRINANDLLATDWELYEEVQTNHT